MSHWSEPIVIEQTYQASPDRVWEALTVRDVMVQWYFDTIEEFEARVGFESRFTVTSGERVFPHVWKVTEVIENSKLAYNWTYENYAGDSNVTFDLSESDGGTTLRVTAVMTVPFDADIPEFKRESGVAGWTYLLKNSLKSLLER